MLYSTHHSPIGELLLFGEAQELRGLWMQGGLRPRAVDPAWHRDDAAFTAAHEQLDEYFRGERDSFDLPLAPAGTEFQLRVWEQLRRIPYGETMTYGEVAREIGSPSASRAVGHANGSNPIAVIVPCHRVIGSNGTLTGFGGGLERKRKLLDLEAGRIALL